MTFCIKSNYVFIPLEIGGLPHAFQNQNGKQQTTLGGRKGDPVQGNHYELLGRLGKVSLQSLNHIYKKYIHIYERAKIKLNIILKNKLNQMENSLNRKKK